MLELKYDIPKFLYELDLDNKYVVELEKIKKGKKISILSDTMFRTMMLNTNRLKYSAKLFSYYLNISYDELLKNNFDKNKEKDQTK